MLNKIVMKKITNQHYDSLLIYIAKELDELLIDWDWHEKINETYIKLKIKKFTYIKDTFLYYINFVHQSYRSEYILFYEFLKNEILEFIKVYLNIFTDLNEILNQFFNKLKEEKIEELLILYKLGGKTI